MTTVIGRWLPYQPQEALKSILEQSEGHPFHLALPLNVLSQTQESGKTILGTYCTIDLSPGTFTEKSAITALNQAGARFVVTDRRETVEKLLKEGMQTFYIFESLDNLPKENHLILIDSTKPEPLESIQSFAKRLNESYQKTKEAAGGNVKVLATLPLFSGNCAALINDSPFDGFYLPNLGFQTDVASWILGTLIKEAKIQTPEETLSEKEEETSPPPAPEVPKHHFSNLTEWGGNLGS